MKLTDILSDFKDGKLIRREHWEPLHCLKFHIWDNHNIPVAVMMVYGESDKTKLSMYSFPLNDVLAEDWEIL